MRRSPRSRFSFPGGYCRPSRNDERRGSRGGFSGHITLTGRHVQGSVRQVNGRMRVSTQLARAGGDEHIWAKNHDTDSRDIFRVQQEIARDVVQALEVKLGERGRTTLAK